MINSFSPSIKTLQTKNSLEAHIPLKNIIFSFLTVCWYICFAYLHACPCSSFCKWSSLLTRHSGAREAHQSLTPRWWQAGARRPFPAGHPGGPAGVHPDLWTPTCESLAGTPVKTAANQQNVEEKESCSHDCHHDDHQPWHAPIRMWPRPQAGCVRGRGSFACESMQAQC